LLSTFATPWKGENLRAKKALTLSAKAALKQYPLCAQVLERPRQERLQACAWNAEKVMAQFSGHFDMQKNGVKTCTS
jgi:hypothetical protein